MGEKSEGWKAIWGKKRTSEDLLKEGRSEFEIFCALKKADGFDVAVTDEEAYYRAFYAEFERFYTTLTGLCPDFNSLFELGCGCGVNLFLIGRRRECILGGMDYSESLLESAAGVLKDTELIYGDAAEMPVDKKYDIVMEESVFEYFSSEEYAEKVARLMIEKSNRLVYFGGIYDKELEKEMMAYRRSLIPDYDERYKGLDKSFYSRAWFEKLAVEYGRKILFTEVENPEYLNGKYQYNCYIYRVDK